MSLLLSILLTSFCLIKVCTNMLVSISTPCSFLTLGGTLAGHMFTKLSFVFPQEEGAAVAPYNSELLHFKLRGRRCIVWRQHHLHPEREPPTELQLLEGENSNYKNNQCQRKELRAHVDSLWELRCHALQTRLAVVLGFIFGTAVQQRQVVWVIRWHFWAFSSESFTSFMLHLSWDSQFLCHVEVNLQLHIHMFYNLSHVSLKDLYCVFIDFTLCGSRLTWHGVSIRTPTAGRNLNTLISHI